MFGFGKPKDATPEPVSMAADNQEWFVGSYPTDVATPMPPVPVDSNLICRACDPDHGDGLCGYHDNQWRRQMQRMEKIGW